MNNKLFLGFLIGFVILLVIFIIILLTTEDNNNLIKSIGSSILILFGGSLTGYLVSSKNNNCKCGSYEKCKCGSYEIKGSDPFDWISEKLFGKKNNTQKEVENNIKENTTKITSDIKSLTDEQKEELKSTPRFPTSTFTPVLTPSPTPAKTIPATTSSTAIKTVPTPGSTDTVSTTPTTTTSGLITTAPASTSTPSSSLGSSLPINLSGLPIIAPALKYKESEKKDTFFDKYLAKLLSSSI